MSSVPAGGPSTINGVLYQMLWALNRVGTLNAMEPLIDADTGALVSISLILEPVDGGDQQEVRPGVRCIEQLKARSDGGTWSLQQVITEVFPDLYRSVDLTHPKTEYRFVTEGKPGKWQSVDKFFKGLRNRPQVGGILASLNDTEKLKFGRRNRASNDSSRPPFWDGQYTEKRLFQKIVEVLRQRTEVAMEPVETTQAKLWNLLANFSFIGNQTTNSLKIAIDSWLSALIPAIEQLPLIRDALLLDLARRATVGGQRIIAADFLADHQLNGIPLSKWTRISDRANQELAANLIIRDYDPEDDPRPDLTNQVANHWTPTSPILIITGLSGGGQGKTWLGYSLLDRASKLQEVALLVDATGNTNQDLENAASVFWQRIVGQDNVLPFVRIVNRLQSTSPGQAARPLCLLVDHLTDPVEARHLAKERWENLGIRLAVTCSHEVATAIQHVAKDRCAVFFVPDFSAEELHRYLSDCVGDAWPQIPGDVRAILRRPLLARLYREIARSEPWQPTLEYELYDRYWKDLFERQGVHPQDVVPLYRLARSLLNGASYPWTAEQAEAAGFNPDSLDRLNRSGLIRSPSLGNYEVWHDRLLNWIIAQALVSEIQGNRAVAPTVYAQLKVLLERRQLVVGHNLSYVPMDFVWMLLSSPPSSGLSSLIAPAVIEMETVAGGRLREPLYAQLLPTVGPGILPFLFDRLRESAQYDTDYLAAVIATSVARFDEAALKTPALALLSDERPLVQRVAMLVLSKRPTPEALDRLWNLHCTRYANPSHYLRSGEHPNSVYPYQDSFNALKACIQHNPEWLISAIERADASREPVDDLAYLVANLHDGGACWRRCKRTLFAKVPEQKARCLATNILTYQDPEEVVWLRQRINSSIVVGPVALRALIRITPEVALQELDRLPENELYLTRSWTLAELLVRLPTQTTDHFLTRIREHEAPWRLCKAFQGLEQHLVPPILDILLDAASAQMSDDLTQPLPAGTAPRALLAFTLLRNIATPELLECFRRRRQQRFELNLTNWLLRRPYDPSEFHYALTILAMVGGTGLTESVNQFLQMPEQTVRLEGLDYAQRGADPTTIRLLSNLSMGDQLTQDMPFEQGKAALALASAGCWPQVVAYLVRWGMSTFSEVTDYRHEIETLDDESMAPALSILRSGQELTPGVILALGFGKRNEFLEVIRNTLAQSAPESELAASCVVVLGWLKDDAHITIETLQRLLTVPVRHDDAITALLQIDSNSAFEALFNHLQANFQFKLAIPLLNDSRTAATTIPIFQRHLQEVDDYTKLDVIASLLAKYRDDSLLDQILADSNLRDFLRETAFDDGAAVTTGTRITAILALVQFDPAAGFLAAQAALQSGTAGREGYPYVLVDLDPGRALPVLLNHAATEKSTSVLWAIGRALEHTNFRSRICSDLADPDAHLRIVTCHIASRLPHSNWLIDAVRICLDDPDIGVATAARDCLEALHASGITKDLTSTFLECDDPSHSWTLLEGLLNVADPGDESQPWPTWAQKVATTASSTMRTHLASKIKSRRKEILDLARKYDR